MGVLPLKIINQILYMLTYAGLSSGICQCWCWLCPVVKVDFLCPGVLQWSENATIPFLPHVTSVWRTEGT